MSAILLAVTGFDASSWDARFRALAPGRDIRLWPESLGDLINVGRGALQVDADILAALDEGSLAGATLDVFPTEPLPASSPLWSHPRVTITPHNAAASDPRALVANMLRQIDRFEAGLPLEHVVDRAKGY